MAGDYPAVPLEKQINSVGSGRARLSAIRIVNRQSRLANFGCYRCELSDVLIEQDQVVPKLDFA